MKNQHMMTSGQSVQTQRLPSLFLVGGTGRFVGKSTFAEMLIKHFADRHAITALKISNIKPGDDAVHGWHGDKLKEPFIIEEEKVSGNQKDTQRFLAAGARRSFFLRSFEESLPQAMEAFFEIIPANSLLVVESNTLRHHVQPGVLVMVTDQSKPTDKPDAQQLFALADQVLTHFDTTYFQEFINKVRVSDNGWSVG